MKLNKFIFVASAFFLSSCGENEKVKDAVKQVLIDPDSARFGEIINFKSDTIRKATCVEVNSKNRLGGYAGKKVFVVFYSKDGEIESAVDPLQGNPMAAMVERKIQGSCQKFIESMEFTKI